MTTKNTKTQKTKFKSTKAGLMRKHPNESWERVGAPVYVRALAVEIASDSWFAQICLRTVADKPKRVLISRDDVSKPQTLTAKLLNSGYPLPRSKRDCALLLEHLSNKIPKRRVVITNHLGWHGNQYVLKDTVIGKGKQELVYQNSFDTDTSGQPPTGTLNEWSETIGQIALHSSRMRFGICLALAGPLLDVIDAESFGVNFTGNSSQGKTTISKTIQTIYRSITKKKLLDWDFTSASLDETAAAHCDQVLVIDELARADESDRKKVKKVRDAAYRLASGHGRARSVFYKNKGNPTNWRITFVSSSETALGALAAKYGDARPKGEEVRLIDLPAVVHPVYGVFETVPEGYISEDLVNKIEAACNSIDGVVGRAFITKIAANRSKVNKTANSHLESFLSKVNAPMQGWERRFAKRFGIVYAAGLLGIEFGLLPWDPNDVMQTCIECYGAARKTVSDYDEILDTAISELKKQLKNDALWIGQSDKPSQKNLQAAAGFLREHKKHGKYYAIKPERFDEWFANTLSPKLISGYLRSQGYLITTIPNVDTKPVKISQFNAKQKPRYYCIKANFLGL